MVEREGRPGRKRLDTRSVGHPLASQIRESKETLGLTGRRIAEQAGVSQPTVSLAAGGRASEQTMFRVREAIEDLQRPLLFRLAKKGWGVLISHLRPVLNELLGYRGDGSPEDHEVLEEDLQGSPEEIK